MIETNTLVPPLMSARAQVRSVVRELQGRRAFSDRRFDRHMAQPWREASDVHWTPVQTCLEAVRMLRLRAGERVLDIGSGAGKFCVAASLATLGVFVGVEQRPHLVHEARRLARVFGAWRARFIHADAFDLDWSTYRCLYFYNPFAEVLFEPGRRIDAFGPSGLCKHDAFIEGAQLRLSQMPAGTRVLTYHGYGGLFPAAYERVARRWAGSGQLELWVKDPTACAW